MQLYSTVNSVRNDVKTFNYSKCSREMLFICLSTNINLPHMFKMSAFDVLVGSYIHSQGLWNHIDSFIHSFIHSSFKTVR